MTLIPALKNLVQKECLHRASKIEFKAQFGKMCMWIENPRTIMIRIDDEFSDKEMTIEVYRHNRGTMNVLCKMTDARTMMVYLHNTTTHVTYFEIKMDLDGLIYSIDEGKIKKVAPVRDVCKYHHQHVKSLLMIPYGADEHPSRPTSPEIVNFKKDSSNTLSTEYAEMRLDAVKNNKVGLCVDFNIPDAMPIYKLFSLADKGDGYEAFVHHHTIYVTNGEEQIAISLMITEESDQIDWEGITSQACVDLIYDKDYVVIPKFTYKPDIFAEFGESEFIDLEEKDIVETKSLCQSKEDDYSFKYPEMNNRSVAMWRDLYIAHRIIARDIFFRMNKDATINNLLKTSEVFGRRKTMDQRVWEELTPDEQMPFMDMATSRTGLSKSSVTFPGSKMFFDVVVKHIYDDEVKKHNRYIINNR